MTDEEVVSKLIVPAGTARSSAIQAVAAAREGRFAEADALIAAGDAAINEAHEHQSDEIRELLNGKAPEPVTLIMVHGQDHVMNAIATLDLARQIVGLIQDRSGGERPSEYRN
ncbi:MAG: PTS lactose/cellobiose transporter subunit IIA [Coriobacteriaceae bacterium]|nr:PTS lactose/cellobiose transporter subunit IIA [Coriobacteriaceae bacterium]